MLYYNDAVDDALATVRTGDEIPDPRVNDPATQPQQKGIGLVGFLAVGLIFLALKPKG